jgi:hypothetical protein
VIPEAEEHLVKARDCLARARIILDAGVGEDAGRNAYLAGFHIGESTMYFLNWPKMSLGFRSSRYSSLEPII